MAKLTRGDRVILERNRHKLRPECGFATVVLDVDDATMIERHCPELAELGYTKGDKTDARIPAAIYQGIQDADKRSQDEEAEAERDRIEDEARQQRAILRAQKARRATKVSSWLNPLIDAIAQVIAEQTKRIEALEQRPTFRDAGVWTEALVYRAGEGVSFGGSFWISQTDSNTSKPGTGKHWRLAVKKGRDGKDASQ